MRAPGEVASRSWGLTGWLLGITAQLGHTVRPVCSTHSLQNAIGNVSSSNAGSIRPPDGDTSWWSCADSCDDITLCSPLSPQPSRRREVVAPLAGGPRDLFAYGANGSEWRLWLDPEISGGKITTIPVFNSVAGGFSAGTNSGLLCEAHRLGIRVVDWDTVAGMYGPFEFVNFPERILNDTARDIWIEMAVHFMVASGIDGFGLDIEGPIYGLMVSSAPAREALTTMLEKLKARMEQFVPGSLLAVWIQSGNPWNSRFSKSQLARAVSAVDQFWSMEYSACGMPYAGMPEAAWPWIKRNLNTSLSYGFPRDQIVEVFPWHDCDYNCGKDVNCSKLRPREYCSPPVAGKFCFNNMCVRLIHQNVRTHYDSEQGLTRVVVQNE